MSSKKILIVDDEKDIISTIADFFKEAGYKVESAQTPDKAISSLESKKFELVLLDMRMPGIDGVELLTIINNEYPKTKVIILTGYSNEYKEKVSKLKYKAFLSKPFSSLQLINTVKQVLSGKEIRSNTEKYDDATLIPSAKLLFIEADKTIYNEKNEYFMDKEKCGGRYKVDIISEPDKITEKLENFKPDIVLANISIFAKEKDLQSTIMRSSYKPKSIIFYETKAGSEKYFDNSAFLETFDPNTAIYNTKDIREHLGKIVRETAIEKKLFIKTDKKVRIPGNKEDSFESKKYVPKNFTPNQIHNIAKRVIASYKNIPVENITDKTHLSRHLGVDLYDNIQITILLEEELGIEILDEEADIFYKKFKDIVKFLQKKHR